jgi:hypothetical protein
LSRYARKYERISSVQVGFAGISARVRLPDSLWSSFLVGLLALSMVLTPFSAVAADNSTEYKIKAAILHKFISFIDWPVNSYTDPSASITLGVVGDDPFGDSFENVLGKLVQGRLFGVLNLNSSSPGPLLDGCQILFFPSGISKQEVRNLLEEVADKPILTVGETGSFLEMGGMVNFVEDAGKIRFEVNVAPTEKGGIKIRSRLLRVAVRVLGE